MKKRFRKATTRPPFCVALSSHIVKYNRKSTYLRRLYTSSILESLPRVTSRASFVLNSSGGSLGRICDPLYTDVDFVRKAANKGSSDFYHGVDYAPSDIDHLKILQMQATIDGRPSPN